MLPAQQRLDADQRTGVQAQLRLVMQQQLAVFDDAAQLAEQFTALPILRMQQAIEARHAVAAVALGFLRCTAGAGQQVARIFAVDRKTGEAN